MTPVRIVTDSTAFLDQETVGKYNVAVVPLYVNFENEVIIDGSISNAAFFAKVRSSAKMPFTSQPSPGDFVKVFEQIIKDGNDVVTIVISSGISGTYESALNAAKMVDMNRIMVIDSLSTSGGLAMLVREAAEAAAQGKSKEEITAIIEAKKSKLRIFFVPDTLEYLKKGGRIGGAQALLGTLLKIKPVLHLSNGKVDAYDKVRTMKKALLRIVDELPPAKGAFPLYILHAEAPETVETLKHMLKERFPEAQITISELSPVIGTHTGPGVIGISFYAQ
ncbi:MAG TPA: DegV family protein [Firmicutes bacterium]|nr:DegV family protein [Bacillota bacterium]